MWAVFSVVGLQRCNVVTKQPLFLKKENLSKIMEATRSKGLTRVKVEVETLTSQNRLQEKILSHIFKVERKILENNSNSKLF